MLPSRNYKYTLLMYKYHDVGVFWGIGVMNFLFGAVVITEWET